MSNINNEVVFKDYKKEGDTVTQNFILKGHQKKCVVTDAKDFTKKQLQRKILDWINEESGTDVETKLLN